MATLTLGGTSPSTITQNLEGIFAMSLANYGKTLVDNISKTNALLDLIMKNGAYKSAAGGLYITEELMYALKTGNWYDGYDELDTSPHDGIAQAMFQWRQLAVPIAYSEKERKLNKQRIVELVDARIKMSELGIHEQINTSLLQGAGSGSITSAETDATTGATGIDPLPLLVKYANTVTAVGLIDPATYSWWQNRATVSTATTQTLFLDEWQHMYNLCALGPGGPPKLILCDQTTYELFQSAMFYKFRTTENDKNFNWENTRFKNAIVTFDERVPNVYAGTLDPTTAGGGTAWFLNPAYFNLRYEAETNFVMSAFQKPVNQDAKVAHILWMGNMTISNRKKQGVIGAIDRTLTVG